METREDRLERAVKSLELGMAETNRCREELDLAAMNRADYALFVGVTDEEWDAFVKAA